MSSVSERRTSEVIREDLMYGLQLFDSWLYDEEKPFIHMEAIPTFEFLKESDRNRLF